MNGRENSRGIFGSFRHALSGAVAAVKGERNMRIHLLSALAVTALGVWLDIGGGEWVAVVLCFALVISLECMNTAIEAVVDLASPDIHPLAKKAKDCAAGAVLLAALGAAAVGGVVFLPKLAGLLK